MPPAFVDFLIPGHLVHIPIQRQPLNSHIFASAQLNRRNGDNIADGVAFIDSCDRPVEVPLNSNGRLISIDPQPITIFKFKVSHLLVRHPQPDLHQSWSVVA